MRKFSAEVYKTCLGKLTSSMQPPTVQTHKCFVNSLLNSFEIKSAVCAALLPLGCLHGGPKKICSSGPLRLFIPES